MAPFTSSSVQPRLCCFCIPSRIGTLAISTLSILISVTIALQATCSLFQDNWVNGTMVWVCLLECIVWWSLSVVCVYGWLGTVREKFEWVEWYYELLWWHLWINVAIGTYGIILFSLPSAKAYRTLGCMTIATIEATQVLGPDETLSPSESTEIAATCVSLVKKHLLLIDFAYVIGILIELYLVLMVAHYTDQLADEEAADKWGVDIEQDTVPFGVVGGENIGRGKGKGKEKEYRKV